MVRAPAGLHSRRVVYFFDDECSLRRRSLIRLYDGSAAGLPRLLDARRDIKKRLVSRGRFMRRFLGAHFAVLQASGFIIGA